MRRDSSTAIAIAFLLGTLLVGRDLMANGPFGGGGSGISGLTIGVVPKATAANAIGDSSITDNGTTVSSTETFSSPGSTGSERYGASAVLGTGTNNTVIGNGATTTANTGSNVVIGTGATGSGNTGNSVVIGQGAVGGSNGNSVVIGQNAGGLTGNKQVVIGTGAQGGANSDTVVIGDSATAANADPAVVLGPSASAQGQNNTFVVGSSSFPITDAYVGHGYTSATPPTTVYHATGGSGTDIAGGSLGIAGGKGTGTGIGGDVSIQTAPAGSTGTALNTLGDRFRALAKYTTLTEATATSFARVAIATGAVVGGECVVTVEANDGTDFQARTLRFGYSAVNKAGTITAGIDTPSESVAVSVGTLTCTITAVDATGGNMDLKANCTSSLTQTVLRANAIMVAKNFGTGAISAQ